MKPWVIVTGAIGGIGKAICTKLKSDGYNVLAIDRIDGSCDCDRLIKIDLQRFAEDSDYADENLRLIRAIIGTSALKGVVNNAATQILNSTEKLTRENWRETMGVNTLAPFFLVQGMLEELEIAGGSVVNVASIHAQLTKPKFVCYATSKAALVGLTKAMAVDLGGRIRVNSISPAAISTPMLEAGFAGNPAGRKQLADMHPARRIGEPSEIAALVAYLISEQAGFLSGSNLEIDGAIRSRLHDPE